LGFGTRLHLWLRFGGIRSDGSDFLFLGYFSWSPEEVTAGIIGGLKEWCGCTGFDGGELVLCVFVADILQGLLVCLDVHLLLYYNTIFINTLNAIILTSIYSTTEIDSHFYSNHLFKDILSLNPKDVSEVSQQAHPHCLSRPRGP
jgi:hypothetical protein